jgi:predicted ferric reductase
MLLGMAHVVMAATYLDTPWKRTVWTAVTLFWPLLLAYIRIAKPWYRLRRPYRVAEVRPEKGNAWTLALVPEGHEAMRFAPGQFAWLTLGDSPFTVEEHPFSIASSAEEHGRIELTIKALGDFTSTIRNTSVGTKAYLDGPYGAFSVDYHPEAKGYVFIAGGVGIAPVMSMLRTLASRRDPRPVCLFYGTQNWDKVIFRDELEGLRNRLNLRLVHLLESPPPGWTGETGYLTPDILSRRLPEVRDGFEYFICGPVPLIRMAESSLAGLGVPLGRIHTELYDLA